MAKKRLLKLKDHIRLYKTCKKHKVEYLCSAFDLKSLKFLYRNTKFNYYKIASGEIHSLDCLEFLSKKKTPIILSTGMANILDIKKSLGVLNKYKKKKIIILHCVSNYPTVVDQLNLRFMRKLNTIFNYPVGFSDHSTEILPAVIAVSLGAKIIEKHVTLNKSWQGPDHKASLNLREFKKMIQLIRKTEKILGNGNKEILQQELENSYASKKSCVAKKTLKIGDKISKNHICFKRPGTGVSPLDFKSIINKKVKKLIKKNTIIEPSDLL